MGVPGGERVGRLCVSSRSSDRLFLLTDSQSVPPNNFLANGLLGDLQRQGHKSSRYCEGFYAQTGTSGENRRYLAKTRSLMPFSFPYCTDCTSVRPLERKKERFRRTLLETYIRNQTGREL